MKNSKLLLALICGALLMQGCTAIVDHFDPKARAWKACMKGHAKKHPECGKSTFCKRLNHEIGPGTVLTE